MKILAPTNMNRNVSLDIMKGIGILAVIAGHMNVIPYMPYRAIIFSFHMPLFFILSGYFYKMDVCLKKRMKKDFSRLVIPYLFTAIILFIATLCWAIAKHDNKLVLIGLIKVLYGSGSAHSSYYLANIPSIGAIWFLLALFWCKTAYNYISYNCKSLQKRCLTVFLVSFLATCLDRYVINLPFGILTGLSAMLFFLIGDISRTHKINIFIIIICIVCWIISICYSNIWMVRCYYGFYPVDILGACGGTAFIYWLSRSISKTRFSPFLSWLGINSLIILCFHLIELDWGLCYRLNIPPIWYCQFPVKVVFCILMTHMTYKIRFTRCVFGIRI